MCVYRSTEFVWPGNKKRGDVLFKTRENGLEDIYIHDGTEWAGAGAAINGNIYTSDWVKVEIMKRPHIHGFPRRETFQDKSLFDKAIEKYY